ncbi:hypothetical protein V5O48_005064 [Marasmius crinis-equi]|uniref:Short-chain dehydrogenase n=1 Tax=Marasmius crinis-equi TaxID=585013 RepID=A0ABR3FNF8_9AGAR
MSSRKPVIIVAGASKQAAKGIGLAVTSILLKQLGANVVALSRTVSQGLRDLASDSLLTIECDMLVFADEGGLSNAIKKGNETFKHIDGLVLNAGTLEPLCRVGDDTPLSSWKNHFDINFFSLVTAVRVALPELRKSEHGGRIVFVSSGAAVKGTPGWGPYNASKAAMNSLCRTLAEEESDVISVALRPGTVDTAVWTLPYPPLAPTTTDIPLHYQQMQQTIREKGVEPMAQSDHKKFISLYTDGVLLKPELPGHVIAALALRAPKGLSGQFVSWDDQQCKEFQSQ